MGAIGVSNGSLERLQITLSLSTNIFQQSAPSELLYGILRFGTDFKYKLGTVEANIKL